MYLRICRSFKSKNKIESPFANLQRAKYYIVRKSQIPKLPLLWKVRKSKKKISPQICCTIGTSDFDAQMPGIKYLSFHIDFNSKKCTQKFFGPKKLFFWDLNKVSNGKIVFWLNFFGAHF